MDKRRGKRLPVGTIESFNFHTSTNDVEMYFPAEISLRDISLGGLGIKSSISLDKDITLSVNIEFEGENFVVIGKVVWCSPIDDKYDCGLKLIYMPDELIQHFLHSEEPESKYQN